MCKLSSSSRSWAEQTGRMELCNSPLTHTSPSTAFVFCLTEPSFLRTARQATIIQKSGLGDGFLCPQYTAKKKSLFITMVEEEICVRCTYIAGVHGNMHFTCVYSHRGMHVSSVQAGVLYSCVIRAYVSTCVFRHMLLCLCEAALFLHMPGNVCWLGMCFCLGLRVSLI